MIFASWFQMKAFTVQIFIGGVRPLPQSGRPSGIFKELVKRPLLLGPCGFDGDVQADLTAHGGPDKAVQLYPVSHYVELERRFEKLRGNLGPGALGENISCDGLDEHDVRVGDVWRLGQALLQLSQPRSPCWKIDDKLDCVGVAAAIAQTRRTGWYWRVIRPGMVEPQDTLQLVEPGNAAFRLSAMLILMQEENPSRIALQDLARAPGIAENWRRKIEQRLARMQV